MHPIETRIDTSSPEFSANRENMQRLVSELATRQAEVRQMGSEESRKRHTERGKLLVRDRIKRLLDPETPFLELSTLAAWDLYEGEVPAAGMVTGIGRVCGREVMLVANDATVKGWT